jgi:hypothetical protein
MTSALLGGALVALRARSMFTAVAFGAVLVTTAALWWWRDDAVQLQAVVATGLVLLIGAWRHVFAVMRTRRGVDDPSVLARLTGVPKWLWSLSFLVVAAACSWLVVLQLLIAVPAARPG